LQGIDEISGKREAVLEKVALTGDRMEMCQAVSWTTVYLTYL
jgi:hypothetical protein